MCGPMKNHKVETRSRDSNLGPHDCKADALPHDHGHHTISCLVKLALELSLTTVVALAASIDQRLGCSKCACFIYTVCYDETGFKSNHDHDLPVIFVVAWKEYCAEYWLKEFQESINRCTDHLDITEILLKTVLNTIQSINYFGCISGMKVSGFFFPSAFIAWAVPADMSHFFFF